MQTVLFNLLASDRTSAKGIWAVKITRELWKRQIWTDAKAVEIMKEAALSENEKVIVGGVRFFLGGDKEREEAAEDDSSDEEIDMGKLKHQAGINKKTKKKEKDLRKAASMVKKVFKTCSDFARPILTSCVERAQEEVASSAQLLGPAPAPRPARFCRGTVQQTSPKLKVQAQSGAKALRSEPCNSTGRPSSVDHHQSLLLLPQVCHQSMLLNF